MREIIQWTLPALLGVMLFMCNGNSSSDGFDAPDGGFDGGFDASDGGSIGSREGLAARYPGDVGI